MTLILHKNLFDDYHKAIVHGVNCKGAIAKGFAKELKERYPDCVHVYRVASATLKPGDIVVHPGLFFTDDPIIIHAATQDSYGNKGQFAKLEWIESALIKTREYLTSYKVDDLAMPKIGSGLGGLEWDDVLEVIHRVFDQWNGLVSVYDFNPNS